MKDLFTFEELTEIFEVANANFLYKNNDLLSTEVSERTLCGALMISMNGIIKRNFKQLNRYRNYFVDIEYNRNDGRVKTIIGSNLKITTIVCDLILHSRGHNKWQDNLIAVEMKKSTRPLADKQSDHERLIALTRLTDGVWSADGVSLPEHVCGYVLGVYYEIDFNQMTGLIEYYSKGTKQAEYIVHLLDSEKHRQRWKQYGNKKSDSQ